MRRRVSLVGRFSSRTPGWRAAATRQAARLGDPSIRTTASRAPPPPEATDARRARAHPCCPARPQKMTATAIQAAAPGPARRRPSASVPAQQEPPRRPQGGTLQAGRQRWMPAPATSRQPARAARPSGGDRQRIGSRADNSPIQRSRRWRRGNGWRKG
jgi:hypothetical protein